MTSRTTRLLRASPLRAVLTLAVPTTAVMVLGAASGVVNTYFVARLGADAIAAVSLIFPLNLIVLTMMGGGIGSGIATAVARALGAGRQGDADSVAEHAFLLAAGFSLLLTLGLVGGAPALCRWMGATGGVSSAATIYARVLFSGIFITFSVSAFDSVLRGEGNVRVPSLWATVSLSLQIAFVPWFMFPLGMGIGGAAAATVIGQLGGSLPRAYYVFSGRGHVKPRLFPHRIRSEPILDILRVGVPASLATLANYFGLLLLTAIVARYGTDGIAAFGLGTRLDFLILTLAFGVGSALLTLVGLAAGAGDNARISALLSTSLALLASMLTALGLLLVWKPGIWLHLFTANPEILRVGRLYLRILAPSYPFIGMSMACSFAFQAIGQAVFPLVLATLRTAIVVAAAVALSRLGAPVWSIFLVMAAGNVATTVILYGRLQALLRRPVARAVSFAAAR